VKDGRQTEGSETAQPVEKVVRLPRDWLGPREDLVPFGPRGTASEPDPSASASSPEAPPSAADFWGERSAAIHGALEAPAEGQTEAGADASGDVGAPERRRPVAGFGIRRVAAVTGLALAAAALAAVAFGVLAPSGSVPHDPGGARLNMAAVVSNGVSRTVQRGVALLDASASSGQAMPANHRQPPAVRRIRRSRPVFKRVHETTHPHPIASASSAPPTSHPVVRSSSPSYTHVIVTRSSPTGRQPHSSAASVSPTGQSGALGPIQSPNG
jgi:hypothetical protein